MCRHLVAILLFDLMNVDFGWLDCLSFIDSDYSISNFCELIADAFQW